MGPITLSKCPRHGVEKCSPCTRHSSASTHVFVPGVWNFIVEEVCPGSTEGEGRTIIHTKHSRAITSALRFLTVLSPKSKN